MINVKKVKKDFLEILLKENLKKILDLGCGEGLMSKYFENENAKIIGIDIKKSTKDSEYFQFVEGDIRTEDFGNGNDLIIASLILHFFRKEEAQKIIEKMKIATSPSGYNLLICMSNKDDLAMKRLEKFYPSLGEIKKRYPNWILIKEEKGTTKVENHDSLGPHKHNVLFLLFQKKKV
jgi:SAM-dependent methyltransferase